MRQFLYKRWKPVSTRPPYPELHVTLYSSPLAGHRPLHYCFHPVMCKDAYLHGRKHGRHSQNTPEQSCLAVLHWSADYRTFLHQSIFFSFHRWFHIQVKIETMIWNFRPKSVAGRDGLGRRTGEGGGCQDEPRAQGRDRAADPSFPLRPQASTVSHPLARIMLGKVSP